MKARHVMIDLETMGSRPESAIVSIGAVIFDPRLGVITKKTFYVELDWQIQQRTVCNETKDWWGKQSKDSKEALHGIDDLEDALKELTLFLPEECRVWGNGPTFDITMLENAYLSFEMDIPWKFWNIRDCRTIKDMYECTRGSLEKGYKGVRHNALDDAKAQATAVNNMWKKLVGDK